MIDKIVQEIAQQQWSVTEQVLNSEDLRRLKAFMLIKGEEFAPAKIGKGGDSQRHESIRSDLTLWIDPLDPPGELQKVISFVEELRLSLNQSLFLGLQQFECHLAKYPQGSFYKTHLDRFKNDSSRVLSFIFYLHEEWNHGDGGELVLYDEHQKALKVISPKPGSFVCFLSERFPHEVLISNMNRLSLTGWIHNKMIY
jgi:SM-20-related protein